MPMKRRDYKSPAQKKNKKRKGVDIPFDATSAFDRSPQGIKNYNNAINAWYDRRRKKELEYLKRKRKK